VSIDPDLKLLVHRLDAVERPSREAFALCDEIAAGWGDVESPAAYDAVLMALSVKAHMLRQEGRLEESVNTYDEALGRYEQHGGAPARLEHALYAKALDLVDLHRFAEAVAVCDAFLEEFGEDPPTGLSQAVAARRVRAHALADWGRVDEALADLDAVTVRYASDRDPRTQAAVARSLSWKAKVLADHGRSEEALGAYDEMLALVRDADDADLRLLLISAYVWKGTLLQKLDRTDEARDLYEEAFEAFPQPERRDIDELVTGARRRLIGLRRDPPSPSDATESPLSLNDARAVVSRLIELTRMFDGGDAAKALGEATEIVDGLQAVGAAEALVVQARITQAGARFLSGDASEATAALRDIATSYRHSSDPELRRLAALAQHNLANQLMCSDDPPAGEAAMDDLISEFGEFGADALQEEAAVRSDMIGVPLDAEDVAVLAMLMARILIRCAPQRVTGIADPAIASLRAEPRSPMRDELITQLEQLRDLAGDATAERLLSE